MASAQQRHDPELDLSKEKSDLHSLRSMNSSLDKRASLIQEKAISVAVSELLQNESLTPLIKNKKILVTGGAGYLGYALSGTLRSLGATVISMDVISTNLTQELDVIGSVEDAGLVTSLSAGCDVIFNTAALHAPYATSRHEDEFKSVNVGGIKNVLSTEVPIIIHTSTTSLTISKNVKERERKNECVWLDETASAPTTTSHLDGSHDSNSSSGNKEMDHNSEPRNKYGRSKKIAEQLCVDAALSKDASLQTKKKSVVILRTSRFFCEDLLEESNISLENAMANELLGRRVALVDVIIGHIKAMLRAEKLSGKVYVLSCPWPFTKEETPLFSAKKVADYIKLKYGSNVYQDAVNAYIPTVSNSSDVLEQDVADDAASAAEHDGHVAKECSKKCDFVLPSHITRIYDSNTTCRDLEWNPLWTFGTLIEKLRNGDEDAFLGLF